MSGDGIICDTITGETWCTEHVLVPTLRSATKERAEILILKAIDQKYKKGGAPYASGKTLVVFLNAGAGMWFPNEVAKQLPDPLLFDAVWVVGLQKVEDGEYVYATTRLDLIPTAEIPDSRRV